MKGNACGLVLMALAVSFTVERKNQGNRNLYKKKPRPIKKKGGGFFLFKL